MDFNLGTTTDSGEKLKIFGTAATFKIEGDGVTSANLKFKTNQVDRWNVNVPSGYTDLRFTTGSTDVLTLKLSTGNVLIGTTTDSSFYKLDVNGKQRVQSVLELDDVLTLNAISTPSDPATNKSSIYMDSADGSIKVKINVEGTVVTRTIASFE